MAKREPNPPFRRLRIYAFDPTASTDLRTAVVNEAVVRLPWEQDLAPGPVGEYLEVIDYDPASGGFYAPVDLNQPALLVQDGLPPSEGNPAFHQQMVYAVAMTTIRHFERALGRRVIWAPNFSGDGELYVQRLRIYPHAIRESNAFYSPAKKALLFGYFRASTTDPGRNLPGGMIFTCLSHDVIAHETAHALLDGMHRRFIEASNPDALAFHEAFADIVALFQHFTLPEALRSQIATLRGDLGQRSLLSGLARQFGEAIGHYGALRDAIDAVDPRTGLPDAGAILQATSAHERGAILVAAVFDAFVTIYRSRVADLLRLATGDGERFPDRDLHPDLVARLTQEATKAAAQVLRMCIRALDYLPPVDVTFGDYLRALITADTDLVTEDDRNYRIAMVEAFRRRGIFPRDVRSLAVDSVLWDQPDEEVLLGDDTTFRFGAHEGRRAVWEEERENCRRLAAWLTASTTQCAALLKLLGLRLDAGAPRTIRRRGGLAEQPGFDVHSVRSASRIGPDGEQEQQIVIEITQRRRGFRTAALQEQADRSPTGRASEGAAFVFRGGATVILDRKTRAVRYCIRKAIDSATRLEAQRRFLFESDEEALAMTYFRATRGREPFAFLHRND